MSEPTTPIIIDDSVEVIDLCDEPEPKWFTFSGLSSKETHKYKHGIKKLGGICHNINSESYVSGITHILCKEIDSNIKICYGLAKGKLFQSINQLFF